MADCPDGSDENFCDFTCDDGEEIAISKVCDRFPDCTGGEDENYYNCEENNDDTGDN